MDESAYEIITRIRTLLPTKAANVQYLGNENTAEQLIS